LNIGLSVECAAQGVDSASLAGNVRDEHDQQRRTESRPGVTPPARLVEPPEGGVPAEDRKHHRGSQEVAIEQRQPRHAQHGEARNAEENDGRRHECARTPGE
jgi:hypothetical protein